MTRLRKGELVLGGIRCVGGRVWAGTQYIALDRFGCRVIPTGVTLRPSHFRRRRHRRMAGK